jgi:FAD/FMN-containing dehydrogenase
VADFTAAATLLREARGRLPGLSAFELMWRDYFDASARQLSKPSPFADAHPLYVLVETLDCDEPTGTAALEGFLGDMLEQGTVADAVLAQSLEQAKGLWDLREGVSELLSHLRPCAAFDVSVSLPQMDALVKQLRALLTEHYPGLQHLFFGHLGDGNLHLISGPLPNAVEHAAIDELVYRVVGEAGGSISAEHGIGLVKKAFLHHSRDPVEIALMGQLKRLLDPAQILNRGRVVPPTA